MRIDSLVAVTVAAVALGLASRVGATEHLFTDADGFEYDIDYTGTYTPTGGSDSGTGGVNNGIDDDCDRIADSFDDDCVEEEPDDGGGGGCSCDGARTGPDRIGDAAPLALLLALTAAVRTRRAGRPRISGDEGAGEGTRG